MVKPQVTNTIAQVAGWIFFFSLIAGFFAGTTNGNYSWTQLFSLPFLLFYFVYLFLFYANTYVFIPYLYLAKKYFLYFSIIVLLFIAVYFLKPFDGIMNHSHSFGQRNYGPPPMDMRNHPPPQAANGQLPPPMPDQGIQHGPEHHDSKPDIISVILFITVWSLSTALCIIKQWRLTQQRAARAEADKANAELSFLKAQINPHFLFNTLNNIYSLAVTNHENTAPGIMKLSNIMRYVTDDIGEDYVSLDSEIACMTDYIDLHRMRLGKSMNVDFIVTGNTSNKKIAPLLLMTFIENAFKYGTSNHEPSTITIKLSADTHEIQFSCLNKLFDTRLVTDREGVGIANAKQRLERLYPDKHRLSISKENGWFMVDLTIQA